MKKQNNNVDDMLFNATYSQNNYYMQIKKEK